LNLCIPDKELAKLIPKVPLYISNVIDDIPTRNTKSCCQPLEKYNPKRNYALQIILDLCIPEKELAKTRSQISFIYFQSHS
jgi:hypothetical protein